VFKANSRQEGSWVLNASVDAVAGLETNDFPSGLHLNCSNHRREVFHH